MPSIMQVKQLNTEANRIWKRFASRTSPERMELELELYKKLIDFFHVGDSYYFVFNFNTCQFDIISKEVTSVLGYQPAQINMAFIMDKLHPEDHPWFLHFEKTTVDFFTSLPLDKLMKYKVRYDFRIRTTAGIYKRVLQQVVMAEHDNTGRALRTLGMHTDITYLKEHGRPTLAFIGLQGEPSYLQVEKDKPPVTVQETLTEREKQIVGLLIKGKASKEIADILHIRKQTVDVHRKNMLRKNDLTSTGQLIGKALQYGWI